MITMITMIINNSGDISMLTVIISVIQLKYRTHTYTKNCVFPADISLPELFTKGEIYDILTDVPSL